jgi:GcrA cell cycle regulator
MIETTPSAPWPPGRVAELERLYADGKSYRAIAMHFHVSKSTIIGKCHRLGLPARALPKPRAVHPRPAVPPPKPRARPRPGCLCIFDLTSASCRWPTWGDGERNVAKQFYCDRRATAGLPYCPEHCRVAYSSAR